MNSFLMTTCVRIHFAQHKLFFCSGMLPAIELDGQIITESDRILTALEEQFGPLYRSMQDKQGKFNSVLYTDPCRTSRVSSILSFIQIYAGQAG